MPILTILKFILSGITPVINNGGLVLAVILMSRGLNLTTEQLGQANYILLITAFVCGLGGFGMSEAFYKYATIQSQAILPAIKRNLTITAIVLITLLATNLKFNWLNLNSALEYTLFVALFFSWTYNLSCAFFLGLGQKVKYSLYQISQPILLLSSLWFLRDLMLISIPTLLLTCLLISYSLPLIAMLIDLWSQKKLDPRAKDIPVEITQFANANIILLLSIMALMQTDGLFIVNLSPDGFVQNGIYKSISQIGKLAMAMGVFASIPLAPLFATWFENNNKPKLKKAYILSNLSILSISTILVFITSVFHNQIISLLFTNSQIRANSYLLTYLMAFYCLSGSHYIVHYFWSMAGKISIVWKATLCQAIIYGLGMIVIVPLGIEFVAIWLLTLQIIATIAWHYYFWITFDTKG